MGSVVRGSRSAVTLGGAIWLALASVPFAGCGESHPASDGSAAKDGTDDAGVERDGCAADACTDITQNRDAGFVCADGFDVQDEFTCDGLVDCAGGEDESDALCNAHDEPVASDLFTCGDGTELPGAWRCDGVSDCQDGSDEFYCPTQMAPAEPDGGFVCEGGEGADIPDDWVCDGFSDCPSGDDELDCTDAGVADAGVEDGGVPDAGEDYAS